MKVLIHKSREYLRCPGCNSSGTFHRSRTHIPYERFFKIIMFRYFRCKNCGWRGKFFNYKLAKNGIRALAVYLFIALATAVIVRFILNKVF
ncbi:hypothetical protein ACFLSV_03900 [Bacteroidota bacterium]